MSSVTGNVGPLSPLSVVLNRLSSAQICAQINRRLAGGDRRGCAPLAVVPAHSPEHAKKREDPHEIQRIHACDRGARTPVRAVFPELCLCPLPRNIHSTPCPGLNPCRQKELRGFGARNRDHIVVMRHKTVCSRKATLLTIPGGPFWTPGSATFARLSCSWSAGVGTRLFGLVMDSQVPVLRRNH